MSKLVTVKTDTKNAKGIVLNTETCVFRTQGSKEEQMQDFIDAFEDILAQNFDFDPEKSALEVVSAVSLG